MTARLVHELKCWPEYFKPLWAGDKWFDIRFGDRDYRIGDTATMREWDPDRGQYTGRVLGGLEISYILRGPVFGLRVGWVILGFEARGKKLAEENARLRVEIRNLGGAA